MLPFLNNPDYQYANCIYDFSVYNIKGEVVKLDAYRGFLCIIVNTASKSPFAEGHYRHFNELMNKYGGRGLRVLAFPCNQFGLEEPGTNEEIAAHARAHNVVFDMFAKVEVNGINAHPLFKFIKNHLGGVIKWSFTKFIIKKDGLPVERKGANVEPYELKQSLEKLL